MPGGNSNLYTWTIGPIRFVCLSTEVYILLEGGSPMLADLQFRWLVNVLRMANTPAERALRPWLIVLQHRPIYCSDHSPGDCPNGSTWLRTGSQSPKFPGLKSIYSAFKVDLVFAGHEHQYERSLPVCNNQVQISNVQHPYTNAIAPVYIVTGAAVSLS